MELESVVAAAVVGSRGGSEVAVAAVVGVAVVAAVVLAVLVVAVVVVGGGSDSGGSGDSSNDGVDVSDGHVAGPAVEPGQLTSLVLCLSLIISLPSLSSTCTQKHSRVGVSAGGSSATRVEVIEMVTRRWSSCPS